MKKGTTFFVFILCFFVMAGCVNQAKDIQLLEENSETGNVISDRQNHEIKIALVMKTLTNPFFIEMEKGARKAQEELGIDLIVKTGAQETSIDQQIAIVEELIEDNVNAIVIAPGGSMELIPVLKKAQDEGIAVVNLDNQLDTELSEKLGLKEVPFISVNNVEGSYLSAKYIADMLNEPAKAAILEGIASAKNAKDRKEGAIKAFKECSNVTSVVTAVANWKIDEAYIETRTLMRKNPDIGLIFCSNDMMALGAIQYLQEAKRTDVLVAGYDALKEALEALKNGSLAVTIDQQASLQGYTGIKCAFDLIQHKTVNLEQIIDVKVVTD